MKSIGGNVVIKNGIELDYPFVECILSLLPVCDVVQVCDGGSTDGTLEVLNELSREHSKVRIINYPFGNPRGQVDCILDWENYNRERLGTEYNLMLEADEVLGPESYEYIRKSAQSHGNVLGMERYNFWIDHRHILSPGHVLSPQVIRFAPTVFFMGGDAPHPKATQTEPAAQWSAQQHCKIYHYGFIRRPEAYLKKFDAVVTAVLGSKMVDPVFYHTLTESLSTGKNWMEVCNLPNRSFFGTHPPSISKWLRNRGYLDLPGPGMNHCSETAKYRHLTTKYCYGCGVDIASHGDPVVPWAFSLELPPSEYRAYNGGADPLGPVQIHGHAQVLPFPNDCLDFVYSSHLLEDFSDWEPLLREWVRVLKPKGFLLVLVPDKGLWQSAMAKGQPNNPAHKHESFPGELSTYAERLGLTVIQDRLTALCPEDYTILFVAKKNE